MIVSQEIDEKFNVSGSSIENQRSPRGIACPLWGKIVI